MQMTRCIAMAVAATALCFTPVASAQSNPVVQHYRAYVAAMESGDLTTAAIEAEAALAASEVRDGDGGRTAILSLNLATVHLLAGQAEQARPAAQRALDLAHGGAVGVNPALAELVVARSTLVIDGETRAGEIAAEQLSMLINSPPAQELEAAEIYAAAQQLGNWSIAHREFQMAQDAWGIAGANASGSRYGEVYGLGRARTSEGISMVLYELNRYGSGGIREDEGYAAHALLSEAVRVLHPLAQVESPTLELTLAQQTYAEAVAWMHALDEKLRVDGHESPPTPQEAQGDADGMSEIGPVDLTRPRCMMRVIPGRMPRYPTYTQIAAVVLFFRVGADGQIVAHQVAARAGSEQFADAIERVIHSWRVERLPESAANCRMEANLLQTVRFVMPD